MTMEELLVALHDAGVIDSYYEVDGHCPGQIPSDGAMYLRPEEGAFVVGIYERGKYEPLRTFATEDEAARWMYERLTRPQKMGPPLTEAEERAAAERAQEMIRQAQAQIEAARAREADDDDPDDHSPNVG
jgi:hypothetical protein